jgi:hypothetical protein
MGEGTVLTKSHKGEICHRPIPDGDLNDVGLSAVRGGDVDLPGLGSDLLDGAHEDISDDGDAQEAEQQKENGVVTTQKNL